MQSIDDLRNMQKQELLSLWREQIGTPTPPARVDRLIRELGFRLQEQQYGRLDKNTAVSLRRHVTEFRKSLAQGKEQSSGIKTPRRFILERGSVLTRDWEGQRITVYANGPREFVWEGKCFKSLSAVAKRITGQHMSGPLFFGLKDKHHA